MVNYILATEEQRELAEDARKILEKELSPALMNWSTATTAWANSLWT